DPGLRLVETPGLDLITVGELVLGDRFAVDAADRREVSVVIRDSAGDDQDEDRQDDDQAEAEVEVEVPSVLGLPRRFVVAFDNGFCSKRHGCGSVPVTWPALGPGMEGRGMVHRALERPGRERYGPFFSVARACTISSSVTRAADRPSATSNDASRKRSTRSMSKSP